MRNHSPSLLPIFRSQHQAELLTWLFLHPAEEFTVSDLAERIQAPVSTVHGEIVRLDHSGIIVSRSLGRNRLVRVNQAHPAYSALTQLFEITFGPKIVIAEEFDSLEADYVIIFGSWAERYLGVAGLPPSYVDVLVVGDVQRSKIYEAADRAQRRLGLPVNPLLRSLDQWQKQGDTLMAQIRQSATVTVLDKTDKGISDGSLDKR